VVPVGVAGKQTLHAPAQVRFACPRKQVDVVGHQGIRMDLEMVAGRHHPHTRQERETVFLAIANATPAVPPAHHMVPQARSLYA